MCQLYDIGLFMLDGVNITRVFVLKVLGVKVYKGLYLENI